LHAIARIIYNSHDITDTSAPDDKNNKAPDDQCKDDNKQPPSTSPL